jgi:signal transduction histidine kinase
MTIPNLDKLAVLLEREREAVLSRWRGEVRRLPSAKHLDTPALNDHIPLLIDELITAFRRVSDQSIPEALLEGSPPVHGQQRYADGFDIVEVVAEYNILRGCIYDLSETSGVSLQGKAFHILNRVLDEAIGLAVQTFATQQALEVQRRREEYLAFVAHDLRTPLEAIALATRVLDETLSARGDTETAVMLRTLHRNVQHLQALVGNVLRESDHINTERGIKLERRDVYVWPLVQGLIHDVHPMADTAGVTLANEIPEDLCAYADASALKRVFQNLVANAIRYAPRGEIVLGARDTGTDGAVECWVRDNGAGIPRDRLEVIFDKGDSDPEREGGSGLGLAIVKTLVEGHGGSVIAESTEGAGATFRFKLPGKGQAGARALSRPLRPVDGRRPQQGYGRDPPHGEELRDLRHPRRDGVSRRLLPAGADQRQEVLPDLRQVL